MNDKKIKAHLTEIVTGTEWVKGRVGKYTFEAKLHNEGVPYSIKNGTISKLSIWDEEARQSKKNFFIAIVNYSRDWDIIPTKEFKPYLKAVEKLLKKAYYVLDNSEYER